MAEKIVPRLDIGRSDNTIKAGEGSNINVTNDTIVNGNGNTVVTKEAVDAVFENVKSLNPAYVAKKEHDAEKKERKEKFEKDLNEAVSKIDNTINFSKKFDKGANMSVPSEPAVSDNGLER